MLDRVKDNAFLSDVLTGLSVPPKSLPCKYFYDERGSALFEEICRLDEYYVTRTELEIMRESVHEMADIIGPNCALLEIGSGAGIKTRLLLEALEQPRSYTPLDISEEILLASSAQLREAFPGVLISPVLADYTEEFPVLTDFGHGATGKKVVYFPGSTLGNFNRAEAEKFLIRIADLLAPGDGLLIGLDLVKDEKILTLAYDDPAGITAEFNKNLLHRINSEFSANFNTDHFIHMASYNGGLERIEMYLVSECEQEVTICGTPVQFESGEKIHTENSHKYSVDGIEHMAGACGFKLKKYWTDRSDYFSVLFLER